MKILGKSLMVIGVAGMLFANSIGDGNLDELKKTDKKEFKPGVSFSQKIFRGIDLTAEQEAKIKEIHEKYKPKQDSNIDARKELMKELDSDNPSEATIQKLKQDIMAEQETRLDEMIKMKQELDSVLTVEQKNKLKESKEDWGKKKKNKQDDK